MAYGVSNGHVTDDVTWPPKGQTCDPNMPWVQCLENSWRFYLATIANYYLVYCEAVRSAILVTAWLLVQCFIVFFVTVKFQLICLLDYWNLFRLFCTSQQGVSICVTLVCVKMLICFSPLELHLTTSELWFGQEQEGILP